MANFPGSADYLAAASTPATFAITTATPAVNVTDAGGTYNGSPFPATAPVTGVSGTASSSLEGVTPTLTYYAGSTATGTPLSGAPTRGRHVHRRRHLRRQHRLRQRRLDCRPSPSRRRRPR